MGGKERKKERQKGYLSLFGRKFYLFIVSINTDSVLGEEMDLFFFLLYQQQLISEEIRRCISE